MPRLTLELIQRSKQDLNPLKDRQLTLRGNKIDVIENLGATQDYFTCIDLSDNNILRLSSIPKLQRLKTLLLANNKIQRIDADIAFGLTQLESLVLTKNELKMLSDLEPIGKIKTLKRLSLLDNDLTKLPDYRLYVIHICKNTSLRVVDFQRITDAERKLADTRFSGPEGEKYLKEIAPKHNAPAEATKEKVDALDNVAVTRIQQAIMNANTVEEVTMLEKALKGGHLTLESLEELLKPQKEREAAAMKKKEEEEKPVKNSEVKEKENEAQDVVMTGDEKGREEKSEERKPEEKEREKSVEEKEKTDETEEKKSSKKRSREDDSDVEMDDADKKREVEKDA